MQSARVKIRKTAAVMFILAIFFISGCQTKPAVEKRKKEETVPVKVMRIQLKDLDKTLEYVGNIKAQDETLIYPKVSGKIIEKTKEEGAEVNKGDVIAYIDRDEVGLKFEKAPVESPISGVIGTVYVDIGSNVSSQTPVALVVNMETVKINLDIPEKFLPKVYLGQEAGIIVDAYPDEIFRGVITKMSPVVSLENRAAPVEIAVNNEDYRLKSGMFARVSLVIESRKNTPIILKESIIGTAPDNYVYVIEKDKAVLKKVTLGLRQGEYYEVVDGIKEGELVVIVGQQRLYDNAAVNVEEEKQ